MRSDAARANVPGAGEGFAAHAVEACSRPASSAQRLARAPVRRSRSRRAVFLTWLRRTHLYLGLWGAVLGLLFGVTGILLNHRAVMKIPVDKVVLRSVQLQLPSPSFATPRQMSAWLQNELGFAPGQVVKVEAQPARTVTWADREVTQPERWAIVLQSPARSVNAEHFVGNRFVKLDHQDATPVGLLTRLHMATGAGVLWVLLSDTIAGSLILLSITGVLLWTQLHTVRTAAALTGAGAFVLAVCFAWPA